VRYELRALSVGEILGTAFQLLRDNALLLVAIAFTLTLPAQAITHFFQYRLAGTQGAVVTAVLSGALVLLVVTPFVSAAITHAIGSRYLGHPVTYTQSYRVAFELFGRLLATALLGTGAILLGGLLFVLPGVYLILAFMLVYQVVTLERVYAVDALKRSRELTRGNLLRVAGVYLVGLVISSALQFLVTLALYSVPLLAALAIALVGAVVTAYLASAYVVLYFDLRCRKEGFDQSYLASSVEGGESDRVAAG